MLFVFTLIFMYKLFVCLYIQIIFEEEPNAVTLYKFVKKHATTPFTIQKTITPSQDSEASTIETITSSESISTNVGRDEL